MSKKIGWTNDDRDNVLTVIEVLLDLVEGRLSAPELEREIQGFWEIDDKLRITGDRLARDGRGREKIDEDVGTTKGTLYKLLVKARKPLKLPDNRPDNEENQKAEILDVLECLEQIKILSEDGKRKNQGYRRFVLRLKESNKKQVNLDHVRARWQEIAGQKRAGQKNPEIVDLNEGHRVESSESSPQPVATSAILNTTPPPVDEWRGRQEEMNKLQKALDDKKVRSIGITAAGGYGKSALAVKFKKRLISNWRVLWVSFIQPYPLAQFGRWLLEELGQAYDEKWDETTLIQQIIAGLIAEPCLLVLDNMETVIPADGKTVYSDFLKRWLGSGYNSKLLLTGREKPELTADLQGSCYWLALDGLAEDDAIRLVTEDYGLTGTKKELAHFVNRLGRHPLLMRLVCSWMQEKFWKGVGVKKVKELGLDDLFTVKGFHRDPDICVKKVIEASLNRLSPQLGDILTRLSVLRGIFDLDLGLAVTAEATEAELRHLARLSLLQEFRPEEGKPRRFQFLPLISMVVRDRANSEVLATAHQSPLDYFLAHSLPQPWESLDELTEYLEAFYHAGELKQWQLAYDILNEDRGGEGKNKLVDDFLNLQGFNQQRARLYERVIERSDKEKRCYGNSHCHLGNCYDSLGQYQEAIDHHRRSLEISKEIGDRRGEAISLGNSGNCYNSLGRYQEAIDHHRRSLEIKKEIGDRRGEAISLGNLGLCYKNLGRYPEAIDHHRQHHEISKEIGDRRGEAISLGNSGNCYDSLGRYEEAIDHYRRSLEIKKEIGDRQGVAISLHNIGNTLIELENYSEAETKIQESLVISQAIKYKNLIAESFKFLAEIAHKTNRRDIALGHCQASLVIARELGIPLVKDCEKLLAKPQENMEEND